MSNMNTKKLIGSSAYFTINKEIVKRVGIKPAVLLQHLIDIEDAFFQGIEFYQQVDRLTEDTSLSAKEIRECKKVLINSGAISIEKKGLPSKDHFTIHHEVIHNWFTNVTTTDTVSSPVEVTKGHDKDKELKETKNQEDKKNSKKVFDGLCKVYPKNRINSPGPILKYLDKRSKDELILIVKNVKPYLEIAGDYVKNLRNYLEHECWTDEWIQAEKETKLKKESKNNGNTKNNANSFKDRNAGFYD